MTNAKHIGVLGAGAWGTAMAQMLASTGRKVTLWANNVECITAINETRENSHYLKGVALHTGIKGTTDMSALDSCDVVLSVIPAQATREVLEKFNPFVRPGLPIMLCSKGIEISSMKFMSQVVEDVLPQAVPAVLSGPSFAIDVARGLPTAVTLACENEKLGAELMQAVGAPTFRPYWTDDVLGAEIGGAVKNVLAIVCGIVLGKNLGRSAHAATITRGFAEMTRLGTALGCKPETLTGMSGIGDLVLTCSSELSRNMSCGMALGRGMTLDEIMASRNAVTEGVATAPVLAKMADKLGVDMPICQTAATILAGHENVGEAITRLLSREFTSEFNA